MRQVYTLRSTQVYVEMGLVARVGGMVQAIRIKAQLIQHGIDSRIRIRAARATDPDILDELRTVLATAAK